MARPLDIRQSIYRYSLNQLFTGTGKATDKIVESINSDLAPLFRILPNDTLTVSVESAVVQNPQTLINRAPAPVGGYIDPSFTSGTITFPSASGGLIVVTTGDDVTLTLGSDLLCKVLVYITATGDLAVKVGRPAATVSAAITPSLPNNCYSVGYIVVRNVAGVIQPIPLSDVYRFTGQSFASARDNTGFVSWGGSGAYYSIASNQLTLLRPGAGYIHGTYVTWLGSQTTATLTANTTTYIYIDANGLLQTTTTRTSSTHTDGIVLFEVLNDGTTSFVVKECHPYGFESESARFVHDNVGTVISGTGANTTRITTGTGTVVTDRQVKLVGSALLEDQGVITTIPDSAGAAISWNFFYTNASGKWIRNVNQSQMAMSYNNAGTLTALTNTPAAGSVGIVTFYLGKDDFSGIPLYIAVINNAVFNNVNTAKQAITNDIFAVPTNELAALEPAKIGHAVIVNNASGGYISEVVIKKDTLRSSGFGTLGDHSALNNLLEDTHTQYALLAGRNNGQTIIGGQNASGNLILRSTAHATKGKVWVDETTAASSPTVAALVVAGGVGIGGGAQIAGDIFLGIGQKLDTAAPGVLNIGTLNATTINIGNSGTTVNVAGTLAYINTTNVEITDRNVTINKGGGAIPDGAGFTAESNTGNLSILTDTALASKWKIGVVGAESEVITAGTVQTITGSKTFTNTTPVFQNTGAANNTIWMRQTTTAANGNVSYASVVDSAQPFPAMKWEVNNGTAATGLTAARPYFAWYNGATELGRVDSAGWQFLGSMFQLPVVDTTSYPSPSVEGMIRYNTTPAIEGVEFYEGSSGLWQVTASRMFATAQAIVFG
jgi:hypothetical protein